MEKGGWEQIPGGGRQLLDALPVGVAVLEPAHPFRCVYSNPLFARWAWSGINPTPGASAEDVLSDAVSDAIEVLGRAVATRRPQLLTGVARSDGTRVPVAMVGPVVGAQDPSGATSLVVTALAGAEQALRLGADAGILPGLAEQIGNYSSLLGEPPSATIKNDGLTVHVERQIVERDGRRHRLTWTEWQLFSHFLRNPGTTFSRAALARVAWGEGFDARLNEVDVYISRVRRKVEADPKRPRLILTVRGVGYRLASSRG